MAADSRLDRHRMRQRGAGARDIKVQFGFSFSLPRKESPVVEQVRSGLQQPDLPFVTRRRTQKKTVIHETDLIEKVLKPSSRGRARRIVKGESTEEAISAAKSNILQDGDTLPDSPPRKKRKRRENLNQATAPLGEIVNGAIPSKASKDNSVKSRESKKWRAALQERAHVEVEGELPVEGPKPAGPCRRGRPPKSTAQVVRNVAEDASRPKAAPKKGEEANKVVTANVPLKAPGASLKVSKPPVVEDDCFTNPQGKRQSKRKSPIPTSVEIISGAESSFPPHVGHEAELAEPRHHDSAQRQGTSGVSPRPPRTQPRAPSPAQIKKVVSPEATSPREQPKPPSQQVHEISKLHQAPPLHKPRGKQRANRPMFAASSRMLLHGGEGDWRKEDWFEPSVPASLLQPGGGGSKRMRFRP